jgi:hypothetical protein
MSRLFWCCVPLVTLAVCFNLIALLNWDYEAKLFRPATIHGTVDQWIGLKLFSTGIIFGMASSLFHFLATKHNPREGIWELLNFSGALIVALACLVMAMGFIVLGPAAITMMEQMTDIAPK